jgi:hypothetical protein
VYYGVINNRYREWNDVDESKLAPRETMPPLEKALWMTWRYNLVQRKTIDLYDIF